jgi:signal transduction histidine kinase
MRQALSRSIAAFRILAYGYAVVLVVNDHDHYRRATLGWIVLALMGLWTVLVTIGYDALPRWPWSLLGSDLAVAVGAVLATMAVEPHVRIAAGAATLPAAWAAAPVLTWAVAGGPWVGGLAGAVIAAADVAERRGFTEHTFNGVVLLLMAGVVGGYVVRLGQRAEDTVAAAARWESALAERDRLAREIHDSVLQVLALVARRGAAAGGPSAELAAMAAEQEIALRRLVTSPVVEPTWEDGSDLRPLLLAMAGPLVTVSGPADPVTLSERAATAVVASVGEALTNVERHAGAGARAWVLLEAEVDTVTVSVRDDGAGFDAGRLAAAADSGRLGVAQSIRGRIEAVGGTASVSAVAGRGTEVEIRVPR